jgi:P pilus assembly chaperone PapD
MTRALKQAFSLTGLAIAYWLVAAFSVTPTVLDTESTGPRSSARITVVNGTQSPMPVEIVLEEVFLSEVGSVFERRANPADFVIVPPLDTIAAGRSRVFTLQYVGEAELTKPRHFEFSVDQVPVSAQSDGAAVNIVYSITGILSVAPFGSKSSLNVVGAESFIGADGKKFARVTIRNDGNRYDYLSRGTLTLTYRSATGGPVWRRVLREADMRQLIGHAILPAQTTRSVNVPVELPATSGTLVAEFTPASGTVRGPLR